MRSQNSSSSSKPAPANLEATLSILHRQQRSIECDIELAEDSLRKSISEYKDLRDTIQQLTQQLERVALSNEQPQQQYYTELPNDIKNNTTYTTLIPSKITYFPKHLRKQLIAADTQPSRGDLLVILNTYRHKRIKQSTQYSIGVVKEVSGCNVIITIAPDTDVQKQWSRGTVAPINHNLYSYPKAFPPSHDT